MTAAAPLPRNAAALIALRAELTESQCREVIGHLAGYRDPVVLVALAAGIGGAIAGHGLTDEPRPAQYPPVIPTPPEPTHAVWRTGEDGVPERVGEGSEDECSGYRRKAANDDAMNGVRAGYVVLPLGETPDDAAGAS